jgi:glyoxylase-like metal-dependent hydrolase (beta-lactamase superfamily II)
MLTRQPMEIRAGILLFKGRISRNLLLEPMVSNSYFLEDGDDVIMFDPSCGKEIAKRIETHIRIRREANAGWKRSFLIAGHSHTDHAGNFYLSDVIGAPESHIYVHESGFQDGIVKNGLVPATENMIQECMRYYNFYKALPFPYNLLMYPFVPLDALSPALARKAAGMVGGLVNPAPANGSLRPEPLRANDQRVFDLENCEVRGWKVGGKVILPTPGHSSCSVSLLWPEQKALFVSDADWIGNPLFVSTSLRESISSLEMLKHLAEAGKVDLLLPAHGQVTEGRDQVLSYLDFHIRRLEVMRNEVLTAYHSCGEKKDVRQLTKFLAQESPLFRMLKSADFPRFVVFVHSVVAVCLREEGVLD